MKLTGLIGTTALAMSLGGGAMAQIMTFSHFVPPAHQVHHGVEMWGESLREASGGQIDVRIFPAQQLGRAQDHYDMIASGRVNAAWFVPGYSPGRFPLSEAGELPFMISDAPTGARVMHEWYAEIAAFEMPDIYFCAISTHDPGRIHTTSRIETVDDLRGVKLRPANAAVGNYLAALGAVPVRLAAPEARQAVGSGVVDGVTFPWQTIISFGLSDRLRYHLDLPLYVPVAIYGINPAYYQGLSPELRAVIDAHCSPEWSERLTAHWSEWEVAGLAMLEEAGGHHFHTVSGEALDPWIAASQGVYDEWAASVRARYTDRDPEALLADLRDRLAAAGAGGR